jgi:hypothetical protein
LEQSRNTLIQQAASTSHKAYRAAYPEFKITGNGGITVEEDANNKVVKADDNFGEDAATTHPVSNPANQNDGVQSGDDETEEEAEEGEVE